MSTLAPLRSKLRGLGFRRRLVRVLAALCGLALAAAVWLLAAFLLDRSLQWGVPWRAGVLAAGAVTLAVVFARDSWGFLTKRESVADLALLVESRHGIDSDLIAALQFDGALSHGQGGDRWGSPRLATAVVDYVADYTPSLDVLEGFDLRPLDRRGMLLAAALVVWLGLVLLAPVTVSTFLKRLALGSVRYPSQTVLGSLEVNGRIVPLVRPSEGLAVLRIPQTDKLRFEAKAEGKLPLEGSIRLTSLQSGQAMNLPLPAMTAAQNASAKTTPDTPAAGGATVIQGEPDGRYQTEVPPLQDSVRCEVFLGDTWTDPVELRLVPSPIVELALNVTPPKYAANLAKTAPSENQRQLSVLEGSGVALTVNSLNKRLKSATLKINDVSYPLTADGDAAPQAWRPAADTPLAHVREMLRYEVVVEDEDGMRPTQPLAGQIRLRTDRPPRAAAAALTRLILATATPKIRYGATDDFGLKEVRLEISVVRESGETNEHTQVVRAAAALQGTPSVRDEIALQLAPLKVQKGDEVRVVVLADDDRGTAAPQTGQSEPVVFQVTDRNGILAGLMETDEQSAKQLDSIIQRELGIGASK